jgi:hypothetical protein
LVAFRGIRHVAGPGSANRGSVNFSGPYSGYPVDYKQLFPGRRSGYPGQLN